MEAARGSGSVWAVLKCERTRVARPVMGQLCEGVQGVTGFHFRARDAQWNPKAGIQGLRSAAFFVPSPTARLTAGVFGMSVRWPCHSPCPVYKWGIKSGHVPMQQSTDQAAVSNGLLSHSVARDDLIPAPPVGGHPYGESAVGAGE